MSRKIMERYMVNITDYTIEELHNMNIGQKRAAANQAINRMSEDELMKFLFEVNTYTDDPIIQRGANHQMELHTVIKRDITTGAKLGSEVVAFTYYPNGDMETHIKQWLDAFDKEVRRVKVQYYQDGRQPEVVE